MYVCIHVCMYVYIIIYVYYAHIVILFITSTVDVLGLTNVRK